MSKLEAAYELISDKTKNPVTTTEYIKHGSDWLDTKINQISTSTGTKAEKAYVDEQLATKASTSSLTSGLATKADNSTVSALANTVNSKADKAYTIKVYSNLTQMKSDINLVSGDKCKTLGYYSANDGGDAYYIIKESSEKYNETLGNNLVAELIHNGTIKAECIGLKGDDNTFDCTSKLIEFYKHYSDAIEFDSKAYYFSECCFDARYSNSPMLIGKSNVHCHKTFFKQFSSNQRYVIKIGGRSDCTTVSTREQLAHAKIVGVTFSGCSVIAGTINDMYGILCIDQIYQGHINVAFSFCNSRCITYRESFEICSDWLQFRDCYKIDVDEYAMYALSPVHSGMNNSNHYYNNIDAEQVNSKLISINSATDWIINRIAYENGRGERFSNPSVGILTYENVSSKSVGDEIIPAYRDMKHQPIITVNSRCCVNIGEIALNSFGHVMFKDNSQQYCADTLFAINNSGSINVNSVSTTSGFTSLDFEHSRSSGAYHAFNGSSITISSYFIDLPWGGTSGDISPRYIFKSNHILSSGSSKHVSYPVVKIISTNAIIDVDKPRLMPLGYVKGIDLYNLFNAKINSVYLNNDLELTSVEENSWVSLSGATSVPLVVINDISIKLRFYVWNQGTIEIFGYDNTDTIINEGNAISSFTKGWGYFDIVSQISLDTYPTLHHIRIVAQEGTSIRADYLFVKAI